MDQDQIRGIRILLPDLEIGGQGIGARLKFCIQDLAGDHFPGSWWHPRSPSFPVPIQMTFRPKPETVIDIGFQQRISAVRAVAVADADIDGSRELKLHGKTDDIIQQSSAAYIIQSLHQLGCTGKTAGFGHAKFYDSQAGLRSRSFQDSAAGPAVSGRDAEDRRAVSAGIAAGDLFQRKVRGKSRVQLLFGIEGAQPVAGRGRSLRRSLVP